ncbi:hypothetical protein UFOVP929_39 [uncultured Caudovirales phage]|uniref:Uncharacterized protein n=1 Tax=uncultured Caudovirales phage TaxID=2100421 RepID=A0A6J5PLN1_9CAUD|nr:hypothetical protein UFOVP929_39 [uncultured Caudovirales phage]
MTENICTEGIVQRNRETTAWKLGVRYGLAPAAGDAAEVLWNRCLQVQHDGRTVQDRQRIVLAFCAGRDGDVWQQVAS